VLPGTSRDIVAQILCFLRSSAWSSYYPCKQLFSQLRSLQLDALVVFLFCLWPTGPGRHWFCIPKFFFLYPLGFILVLFPTHGLHCRERCTARSLLYLHHMYCVPQQFHFPIAHSVRLPCHGVFSDISLRRRNPRGGRRSLGCSSILAIPVVNHTYYLLPHSILSVTSLHVHNSWPSERTRAWTGMTRVCGGTWDSTGGRITVKFSKPINRSLISITYAAAKFVSQIWQGTPSASARTGTMSSIVSCLVNQTAGLGSPNDRYYRPRLVGKVC
jgi:hypothetical protein